LIAISAGLATRPLLSGLSSPYYVTFAKNLNFRVVVRTEAVNYTAQLVVSVAVALLTHSYWAIVAGVVAASIANVISAHWVAPYRPRFTLASWRKLMAFSVWMTLAQPIVIIGGRFENFLAGGMLGVANFGAYNVGSNVSAMATQSATVPLERVLFPSFAKITGDPERLRAAFQKAQSSLFAIGLPLGVGLALVAQPFVHLVLGPKWAITASVIEFLAPVFGIQMAFGPTYALTFALGATRTLFIRSVMLMIFRVPIVLVGLYFYGLTGLLVARVVSGLLESLVNIYIVRSLIGVSAWEQVRVTWRSAVSGLVMVAAVLMVRTLLPPVDSIATAILALLILVPVGAVTYVGAHILVWVAAGRPGGGIEVEIHKVFEKYGGRLRRRPRQAAQ
jgi:PST family polysaccharide transporter